MKVTIEASENDLRRVIAMLRGDLDSPTEYEDYVRWLKDVAAQIEAQLPPEEEEED